MMRFTAQILLKGINPYVLVSAARATRINADWKKPMSVLMQVNGCPEPAVRTNMMPTGDGNFYLYLDGEVRNLSNTRVGDRVEVSVIFDSAYQGGPQHTMPLAFEAALERDGIARSRWDALAPSLQKDVLRYFAGLKSEAAVTRNIGRAVRVLSGAKERFLARDWN